MMDLTFNDQTQYKVLEFAAKTAQVSLYPELSCGREWFSILPDEQRTGFWFTVIVKDQDLFRFEAYAYPEEIFFSVSGGFSCKNADHAISAKKSPFRKQCVRPFFTSHCARYIAVARIRL